LIQPSPQTPRLIVYGAGDHGLVVAEAGEAAGFTIAGYIDDAVAPGHIVGWWPVLASNTGEMTTASVIVGIGDNHTRRTILDPLSRENRSLTSVVHPSAWVSLSAHVDTGVFIAPQVVVHAEASVDRGAIVNTGAFIEHHCHIGAFAHVAPGVVMGGRCAVGEDALIGLGARILPGRTIGHRATVGAGAVVTRDVADDQAVTGVPARSS